MARDPSLGHSPLVLSIDVGSSSVRAAAHTVDGSPLPGSEAQIASSFDTTPDGGVQIDPDALFDRMGQAIDVTLQRLGSRASAVQGVGASVFASSVLGVSEAGDPRKRPSTPTLTPAAPPTPPSCARNGMWRRSTTGPARPSTPATCRPVCAGCAVRSPTWCARSPAGSHSPNTPSSVSLAVPAAWGSVWPPGPGC